MTKRFLERPKLIESDLEGIGPVEPREMPQIDAANWLESLNCEPIATSTYHGHATRMKILGHSDKMNLTYGFYA